VAIHYRDETLLAFMESRKEVKIYIYRGTDGFVHFRSIQLSNYAYRMTSVVLPPRIEYKCDRYYLVIQMGYELQFIGVKVDGNCGLSHIECDNF
jgi:hypothetical protein